MAIPFTVTVGAAIAPTAETDSYPVTNPKYGLGALRTVEALKDRNDITEARREVGMIVYVSDEDKYYKLASLSAPSENEKWVELVFLPATLDTEGNIHIEGNLIVQGYIQTSTGIMGDPDTDVEYLGNNMELDGGSY
jgi:hypothetical protein